MALEFREAGPYSHSMAMTEAGPDQASAPGVLPNERRPGFDEMLPAVYDELRRLATNFLRGERTEHTLQGTALVHETYLRLRHQPHLQWENPAHLVGIFARVMREILINHGIAKNRLKRGGPDRFQLTLEFYEDRKIDVRALDEALRELETLDRRQAQVVELRFFAGLTVEEIAEVLAISPATVKREWTTAKVWLRRELSSDR